MTTACCLSSPSDLADLSQYQPAGLSPDGYSYSPKSSGVVRERLSMLPSEEASGTAGADFRLERPLVLLEMPLKSRASSGSNRVSSLDFPQGIQVI